MPDVRFVLLRTVRPAFVRRISLAAFLLAVRKQTLRERLVNVPWAQRAPSARLPRLLVLAIGLIAHLWHGWMIDAGKGTVNRLDSALNGTRKCRPAPGRAACGRPSRWRGA